MSTRIDELVEQARQMGLERGKSTGSWIIDGNSSKEFCQKIIEGYDDGDPEIMDMCPSPLSGEWADDPTPTMVLRELGFYHEVPEYESRECLDSYEYGFVSGFWEVVIQTAYAFHGGYEPCGVCKMYGHKAKDHD